ncbi:hypothetical protein LJ656_08655 [Paraburkholderia sp. MMS20-SJTR3]|uniref:Uncharacterized protein n=1 Tax=Paraburkholderia sejongensis TaxID=2886946 RepID=A0ABS8JS02_9BURK|nr:hypothetical protein [Paraburkholderia sp. MMS20-SJTR3]MCC8392657.1 hypothetical protein [Paraburkholderia sp. MMS20-SJTR3]
MKRSFLLTLLLLPALCLAESPQCDRYPTNVAEIALRNSGFLKPGYIDYSKIKAVRLASEKTGKDEDGDQLWRQVYHITFHEKSGKRVSVITASDAGSEECSMSQVEVFVVAVHLPLVDPLIKELDDYAPQP